MYIFRARVNCVKQRERSIGINQGVALSYLRFQIAMADSILVGDLGSFRGLSRRLMVHYLSTEAPVVNLIA